MSTVLYANDIAEEALREIGAYTTSMQQADAQQMKVAMRRLELVLNTAIGTNVYLPSWAEYDIPLVNGQSSYLLSDYVDDTGVNFIMKATVVDTTTQRHYGFDFVNEMTFQDFDGTQKGRPRVGFVDKTPNPTANVWPPLGPETATGQYNLHIVVQTYANAVDPKNPAKQALILRPTWYLWAIKKLAYACGCGPIFRLPADELQSLEAEIAALETALMSKDGKHDTTDLPVTIGHDAGGIHHGWDGALGLNRPDYHRTSGSFR